MKLLTAEQIRALDAHTIKHEPITSLDLMERAAEACHTWIVAEFSGPFIVVCGTGNNGGDGLAIARMLGRQEGIRVEVWVAGNPNEGSADFQANFERLAISNSEISMTRLDHGAPPLIDSDAVVIDALFGTGLTRSVEGWRADVIQAINQSEAKVISIDIPSGLFADLDQEQSGPCIQADHTLTFQVPKLSMLFRESGIHAGEVHVLDIGLDADFHQAQSSNYFLTTSSEISPLWRDRATFEHKGSRGHVMVVAGSEGKMGAAVLASRAVLKSGAGLVTTHVPGCGLNIMQTALPEAMCLVDSSYTQISAIEVPTHIKSLAIGPGIGTESETRLAIVELLQKSSLPIVVDADALNILAETSYDLSSLRGRAILTPHPKEFDRLFGDHETAIERFRTLEVKAKELGLIIVLKGAYSRVAFPNGEVHFNSTGNPGMGTAGSGDVLTGILGSMLAQGYDLESAALVGVYLHGLAGDEAAERNGSEVMQSGEIIDALGQAIALLQGTSE